MLARDHSCLRDLLWRVELPNADTGALSARLTTFGWQDRSSFAQLRDLEGPQGHRLVIVPRTGRMQIRIHYLTAPADRRLAAIAVHEWLQALVSGPTDDGASA